MSLKYIISHDVGTSGNKAVLVDTTGKIHSTATSNYPLSLPHPNWVEQNPEDYWKAIIKTTNEVINKASIKPEDVLSIIYTTQAMGIIPINKDGKVLRPNISWVDGRAEKQAKKIMKKLGGETIFEKLVGIKIMGKDVIPKLLWIKEEEHNIYNATEYFLDVNGYLKFMSTGKKTIEWSGASSYGFDLKKKDWQRIIFKAVGIDMEKLPPLVRSIDKVGGLTKKAADELGLLEGTPVFGGCDDVQSAAVGSGACGANEAHIYLGSAAWVCVSTPRNLKHKNSVAVIQSADPNMNIAVGVTEAAGICIEWIKDQFFKHEQEDPDVENIYDLMDECVKKIPPGSDYLICTPWMLGERCPISTTTTRATLFNISLEHTREHMMRAVYEGVAYNIRWILENLEKDFNFHIDVLKVIGGGALDKEWMQIISNVTQRKIETINDPQMAGAKGGAICAAVGLGIYDNFEYAKRMVVTDRQYFPEDQYTQIYAKLYRSYKSIYYSLSKTYSDINSSRF